MILIYIWLLGRIKKKYLISIRSSEIFRGGGGGVFFNVFFFNQGYFYTAIRVSCTTVVLQVTSHPIRIRPSLTQESKSLKNEWVRMVCTENNILIKHNCMETHKQISEKHMCEYFGIFMSVCFWWQGVNNLATSCWIKYRKNWSIYVCVHFLSHNCSHNYAQVQTSCTNKIWKHRVVFIHVHSETFKFQYE